MAYTTDELIEEVSDHWQKSPDGNFYKLLDTFNQPLEHISMVSDRVADWRQISVAEGTTLDLHGEDRTAYRPTDADDPYRFLIWIKILLSRAQGTVPSIVRIAGTALQNFDGFQVWKTGIRHIAISIPYSYMTDLPTEKFILDNLQRLVAMGIWIDKIVLPAPTKLTGYVGAYTQSNVIETESLASSWWTGWSDDSTYNLSVTALTTMNNMIELKSEPLKI